MEWTIKLEARSGWGEVETIEVGRLKRRVVGLTADEVGLTLAEGKDLLSELQRLVLQTQMDEHTMCARVCSECLTLRRQCDCRTRTIQTPFGTVEVDAPRISVCPCANEMGFVDLSFSPLAQLLPNRCTPELRRVQADLGARHSFREAARLLSTLLPCSPTHHATIRNRTHRVAAEIEAKAPEVPKDEPASNDEMIVMIDGAHIRAAPGYQSRHLDATVGKVEVRVRKEAVLSSQIEGTPSTLSDLLRFETEAQAGQPIDDIREVSHYVDAMMYGLERLAEIPLSLRLIREMHARLLQSGRGHQESRRVPPLSELDWRHPARQCALRAPACRGIGRLSGPI